MADAEFTKVLGEFWYEGILWNNYTTPEVLRRCRSFEFRPTDICVCTFPRTGTTLTQEIVWEIVHKDTIRKDEKFADIDDRFPFLEFNFQWGGGSREFEVDTLPQQQGERLIKTHCPLSLIGEQLAAAQPRIITVARNPKDCCVSLFKFYKGLDMYGPWPGDFDEFVRMFVQGHTMCGNFFDVVSAWWQQRHKPNVLFLKYEDIVRQPQQQVQRIAEFIGRSLTPEQLDCIVHNCRFDTMAANENVNYTFDTGFRFIRKGVVGDWKSQFTSEQSSLMDAAIAKKLTPIGLEFDYE